MPLASAMEEDSGFKKLKIGGELHPGVQVFHGWKGDLMAGTVRIVDDSDLVRQFITAVLNDEGYDVIPAENGRNAVSHKPPRRPGPP